MGEIENTISVNRLSFSYDKENVLEDVSFEITKGKFTIIMGENGSGKSTLLRLISGMLSPSQGEIQINNTSLQKLSMRQKAQVIGFLGQQHQAVFPFTVFDVVMTGRTPYIGIAPKPSDTVFVDEAIEKAGIYHLKNRFYTELSGGEQQLVMIARILAQKPKIMLLDEPISHLDFHNQIRIIKLIKQIAHEGVTVVATMHDPNYAFLFGEDFLFVHHKKVISDPNNEPWNNPLVREIFHDEIELLKYKDKFVVLPKMI